MEKQNNKFLTVSIAAYNVENYIDECLSSFVSMKNIGKLDILVIDDGGNDATMKKAQVYQQKFPDSIRLIYKENGGWGSTVNVGIKEAKGLYFKQLDGDDYFDGDNIDDYIDFLESETKDIVWTPFEFYNENNKRREKSTNSMLQMHSMTFSTKMLKENKVVLLEHCFYTDIELVFNAIKYAKTMVSYDKIIYVYRIGRDEQSVSNVSFKRHYMEHEQVTKKILTMWDDIKNKKLIIDKNVVYDRVLELVCRHFSILYMLDISDETQQKIVEFDNYLKERYIEIYNDIKLKRVKCIRKFNVLYYIIANFLHLRTYVYSKIK